MYLVTIIHSTTRDIRGVTRIGLKSESSLGFGTFEIGVNYSFPEVGRFALQEFKVCNLSDD